VSASRGDQPGPLRVALSERIVRFRRHSAGGLALTLEDGTVVTTHPAGSVSRFQMQTSTGDQGKQTEGMAMHVKVEMGEAASVSYAR
jgi:hypothetical protein